MFVLYVKVPNPPPQQKKYYIYIPTPEKSISFSTMKSSAKGSWGLIFSASKTCLIRLTCAMINRSYSDILGTNTTRGNPTCFMDLMSKAFKTAGPWCFFETFEGLMKQQLLLPSLCSVGWNHTNIFLTCLHVNRQWCSQAFNGLLGCNLLIYRLSVIYEYRRVMSHESLYCQAKHCAIDANHSNLTYMLHVHNLIMAIQLINSNAPLVCSPTFDIHPQYLVHPAFIPGSLRSSTKATVPSSMVMFYYFVLGGEMCFFHMTVPIMCNILYSIFVLTHTKIEHNNFSPPLKRGSSHHVAESSPKIKNTVNDETRCINPVHEPQFLLCFFDMTKLRLVKQSRQYHCRCQFATPEISYMGGLAGGRPLRVLAIPAIIEVWGAYSTTKPLPNFGSTEPVNRIIREFLRSWKISSNRTSNSGYVISLQ